MSELFAPGEVAPVVAGVTPEIPDLDRGGNNFAPGSAFAELELVLLSYGLEELVDVLRGIVVDYPDASIGRQLDILYNSEPYKRRFPAMDILRKKVEDGAPGYVMLNPAEYLQLEQSYRQQLEAYGLPVGFYDEPTDFANWIGGGVSPDEVGRRAKLASDMAQNADAGTKDALRRFYGITDGQITAYFLDPERMQGQFDEAERRARAARLAGAAAGAGFNVDESWRDRAESLAALVDPDMTTADFRAAYENVFDDVQTGGAMAQRYGLDYTLDDAEDYALLGMPSAQRKRRRVAEAEAATFSGTSGVGRSSLSQSKTDSV